MSEETATGEQKKQLVRQQEPGYCVDIDLLSCRYLWPLEEPRIHSQR